MPLSVPSRENDTYHDLNTVEDYLASGVRLSGLLQRIRVDREKYHAAIAHERGLATTDLHCLSFARSDGPLPVGKLSQLLGVTPSAASVIVNKLVRRGLAQRSEHPADRRITLIEVTDEGATIVDRLTAELAHHIMERDIDVPGTTAALELVADVFEALADARELPE